MSLSKLERRIRIKRRIRKVVNGTQDVPRLSVFRSNRQISVQIVDDITGKTLVSASSLCKEIVEKGKVNKVQQALFVGELIAQRAKDKGISKIVFDRNGCLFHGRIKSLADAARTNGLIF